MIKASKSKTNTQPSHSRASARVVDGKLVLSYPHAKTPVVWQMDLAQTKASALEVLKSKDDDGYTLTLKTPKGESLEVAPFETRAQAVDALMAASHALENSSGHIRQENTGGIVNTAVSEQRTAKPKSRGRLAPIILGLLMLLILFGMWSMVSAPLAPPVQEGQGTATSAPGAENPRAEPGVPQSADDLLRSRRP
jgi:hypothetical protein